MVVDKPSGMTSHDVVSRMRRIAGTRKVGHAGTLDPMATGVLIVGVERATRLLGHLALTDKAYSATVRLGVTTVTEDAEGEIVDTVDASHVTDADIEGALAPLRGDILQRPSSVSAIKVDGDVECSTGTYVRALARDLGDALGVGGHLTALRRTRVGPFTLAQAHTLDELEASFELESLADAVRASFDCIQVDADAAEKVLHGTRLPTLIEGAEPIGVFDPDGRVLALAEPRDGLLAPLVVFS